MQNSLILSKPIVLGATEVSMLLSIKKSKAYELIKEINMVKNHCYIKGKCLTKDLEEILDINLDDYLKKANEKEGEDNVDCQA